ncbi:unnamed protein product [marine sediment metagenome]|uniref:Uncharacterized protein n=1 Tax=marine sediment metagenome TaxID=412755 RepID=X1VC74_9ZZZZ
MTKKIDKTQLVKDFHKDVLYIDMAIKHKCHVSTIVYRLKKLGLKRSRKNRGLFSAEERYLFSKMIETHGGRKQLLEILRGK